MTDGMTIWYRGAGYQLGRGEHGYAIWAAGAPPSEPLEQWPETPAGWAAAWSRFTAVETPGTIVRLSRPAASAASAVIAAILLTVGVACGIAGLFPGYLAGTSLAGQPAQLLPHAVYLAAWAASAGLIVSGSARRRAGALLGLGTGIVTFGFFFADVGTVISQGRHAIGPGLALALVGWLACTAGSALACQAESADGPRRPLAGAVRPAVILTVTALAAVGTAVSFAPSWDSYTLRTAAGLARTLAAGNIFANPGAVIAGNVAVMVALAAVAVTAALWQPARLGAALIAGAVIPMAAQAVSALVQLSEHVSPAQFGILPAEADRIGLTVSAGLTPVFWVYCAFVVAMAVTSAWMLVPARSQRPHGPGVARPPAVNAP